MAESDNIRVIVSNNIARLMLRKGFNAASLSTYIQRLGGNIDKSYLSRSMNFYKNEKPSDVCPNYSIEKLELVAKGLGVSSYSLLQSDDSKCARSHDVAVSEPALLASIAEAREMLSKYSVDNDGMLAEMACKIYISHRACD